MLHDCPQCKKAMLASEINGRGEFLRNACLSCGYRSHYKCDDKAKIESMKNITSYYNKTYYNKNEKIIKENRRKREKLKKLNLKNDGKSTTRR